MAALAITSSCGSGKPAAEPADFDYTADRFADIEVQFASGIHYHYSMDKFTPGFTQEWLVAQAGKLPEGTVTNLDTLLPVIFDPTVMPKRVNQAEGQDLILT